MLLRSLAVDEHFRSSFEIAFGLLSADVGEQLRWVLALVLGAGCSYGAQVMEVRILDPRSLACFIPLEPYSATLRRLAASIMQQGQGGDVADQSLARSTTARSSAFQFTVRLASVL